MVVSGGIAPPARGCPSTPACPRQRARAWQCCSASGEWSRAYGFLTQYIQLSNYLLAHFRGLVLGCIEAKFSQPNTRWKALDEIYIPLTFGIHSGNHEKRLFFPQRHPGEKHCTGKETGKLQRRSGARKKRKMCRVHPTRSVLAPFECTSPT